VSAIAPKTILIIDDNEQTRVFLGATLARDGYVVTEAGDSAAAVEALKTGAFAAILLDFRMPHDGVAMIDYLSESMPDVLAHTIVFMPSVNRPIWGVLPKPIDAQALLLTVGACAAQ
jgi:CheY-like chemotaxis protein